MNIEDDVRSRLHQLAAALAHDLALLADRPLHEEAGEDTGRIFERVVVLFLLQLSERVVRDAAPFRG